jgi:hypothetical protein
MGRKLYGMRVQWLKPDFGSMVKNGIHPLTFIEQENLTLEQK